MQQGGIKPIPNQWNRNKSISEANLLASDYARSYLPSHQHLRDPRRNSVADFGHAHDIVDHSVISHLSRPMSKTESHISVSLHVVEVLQSFEPII